MPRKIAPKLPIARVCHADTAAHTAVRQANSQVVSQDQRSEDYLEVTDVAEYIVTVTEQKDQISVSNVNGSDIKVTVLRDKTTPPQDNVKVPKLQRFSKKRAAVFADRVVKAEGKQDSKFLSRKKRYRKTCMAICNSD